MSYVRHIADDKPEAPATERRDRAPAALRPWSQVVSLNEYSYEQTRVMRDAIEMVVRLTKDGAERRDEISLIIVRIADQTTFDANALANLTLAEMAERAGPLDLR
jgi:hypothetical protein